MMETALQTCILYIISLRSSRPDRQANKNFKTPQNKERNSNTKCKTILCDTST